MPPRPPTPNIHPYGLETVHKTERAVFRKRFDQSKFPRVRVRVTNVLCCASRCTLAMPLLLAIPHCIWGNQQHASIAAEGCKHQFAWLQLGSHILFTHWQQQDSKLNVHRVHGYKIVMNFNINLNGLIWTQLGSCSDNSTTHSVRVCTERKRQTLLSARTNYYC